MFESETVEEATAVLVIFCPSIPDFIVATKVRIVEEPLAKSPIFQMLVVVLKLPNVELDETKSSPRGQLSVTWVDEAMSGPLFTIVMV